MPCIGLCFTWEKVERVLSSLKRSSGQNDLPKADPSCLPAPPLSGDSHRSAEDALCAKAPPPAHLPLYSADWSSLCTSHLWAHVAHLICLSQTLHNEPPLQCHPPLLSLSVFMVWRIKSCLRSCSALMTPEPCCAFVLCYSIRPTSRRRSPTGSLAMSVFL